MSTMMNITHLKHHLLVAMPSLQDPHFSRGVVYLLEHNESDGAMGFVINKPMPLSLDKLLKHIDLSCDIDSVNTQPVYAGGPVAQSQGFVMHEDKRNNIAISSSKSTLEDLSVGKGLADPKHPQPYLVILGCAGWRAGQLEAEIVRNDWLVTPYDRRIVFETSISQRWQQAGLLVGVNMAQLPEQQGHA